MTMQTPKSFVTPNLDSIKDPTTRSALEQLVNVLEQNHKGYHEDLAIRLLILVDGDTSPDVSHGTSFKTNNSNPTTITTFDNGFVGQKITILFGDANTTIADTDNINLNAAITGAAGEVIEFIYDGTNWNEQNRSNIDVETSLIQDGDNDTKVQTEESADEDIIRFDTGGTERAHLDATSLDMAVAIDLNKNQLKAACIDNVTSDPASPGTGQIWFRTDL